MEKTHATTSGRDPQRTTEEIDTEVKGDGPEITTTMALIAKSPQDTKTTAIKEVIALNMHFFILKMYQSAIWMISM
jgi:hypothetical protein